MVRPSGGETGLQVGVGGEGIFCGGFGVGGEIGYVRPSGARSDYGFGLASVNPSYHFLKVSKSRKLVPFVTGGFSLFFRGESAIGGNFGGGVTYWFKGSDGHAHRVARSVPDLFRVWPSSQFPRCVYFPVAEMSEGACGRT